MNVATGHYFLTNEFRAIGWLGGAGTSLVRIGGEFGVYDQYGATLARWFGPSAPQLAAVFPKLALFPHGNISFLG